MTRRAPPLAVVAAFALAACDAPPVDTPRPGGAALPPRGVISGTVQYVGPQPACEGEGGARVPIGRVVLTLFLDADPPPPEGTARGALNLLTIPGARLFDAPDDCAPVDPADPPQILSRSAPFEWPDLALGQTYQIRGFYDADADFVPFFPESSQPTAGDVSGGAVDLRTSAFVPIAFDAAEARPEGQVRSGVVVTLGLPTWTERPVFRFLDDAAALASTTPFPATTDALAFEQMLYEAAGLTLSLFSPADTAALDAAAALAVELDPEAPGYAWFVRTVDLDADGAPDPHPVLAGVPWATPLLSLRRLRAPAEVARGVPEVTLVGSVRPSLLALGREVLRPDLDVLVAPVALVELVPGDPACRIPYLPAGNVAEAYEDGPRVCQELPTGAYEVSALQGFAGGGGFVPADLSRTDTGLVLDGGALVTQSWTTPNGLGLVDPADPDAPRVPGQADALLVFDPDPTDGVGAEAPGCAASYSPVAMAVRPIVFTPVPADCCLAVAPLCDLPLCSTVEVAPGRAVRAGGTTSATLGCLAFELPEACCP